MFRNLICAALYIVVVHFAYVTYINPTFEYAHYTYISPDTSNLITTYALTLLVVLAHRDTAHASQASAGLIYTLCYVPSQLSMLFSINQPYTFILPAQLALAISMIFIFMAARTGPLPYRAAGFQFKDVDRGLGLITTVTIMLLIVVNWKHMRFVSFEDVYDLRAESTAGPQDVSLGYLSSWVSYCFISYFFARSIIHRKWPHLCIGIIGSAVLYMSTGSKTSLLLLPMTIGVVALWRDGPGFLFRTLLGLVILILILTNLLPDDGAAHWAKSIIMLRIIGSSGWVVSKYFEYYGSHDITYYTHIGPINSILGGYPYGEFSLGQIIGLEYSGSSEANFNASFWASDGFAALGIPGVLIITIPVAILMYLINRLTVVFQNRFTVAWNTGFFIAILNVPFSTALLSGGGIIILLIAWQVKVRYIGRRKSNTIAQ